MEFKDHSTNSFEQLLIETLDEQMGPPPSAQVWTRIAQEINQPPNQPPRLLSLLSSFGSSSIVSRTFILAFLLIFGSKVFQKSNQEQSLPPIIVPTSLPYSLPIRSIPESDLRSTEMQPIEEQVQPAQLRTEGLGARGRVIFSFGIEAKPVIQAPKENNFLGSERLIKTEKQKKQNKLEPVRRSKPQPDKRYIAT